MAAEEGRTDAVRALLGRCDLDALCDEYGHSALHWAAREGHEDVIALLASGGADLDTRRAGQRYPNGRVTPLMWAVEAGHESVCSQLLSLGADPTVEDEDGRTAIDRARRLNNPWGSNPSPIVAILQVAAASRKTER